MPGKKAIVRTEGRSSSSLIDTEHPLALYGGYVCLSLLSLAFHVSPRGCIDGMEGVGIDERWSASDAREVEFGQRRSIGRRGSRRRCSLLASH